MLSEKQRVRMLTVYTSCSLLEVHGGNGRLALDVRCRRLPSEHVGIMKKQQFVTE
jgi:hypothetical protein